MANSSAHPTESENADSVTNQPAENINVEVHGKNKIGGDVVGLKHVETEKNVYNFNSKPEEKYEVHFRELKKALQCHYTTTTSMVLQKPWKPSDSPEVYAPDFYVDLKFRKYNKTRLVFDSNARANLKQAFRLIPGNHIWITGGPGSGKTTFCNDLAFKWGKADKEQALLPVESTLLVYFSLSNLKDDPIEEQLLSFLNTLVPNSDTEMIRKTLKSTNESIIILFDGFDELTTFNQARVLEFVEQKDRTNDTLAFENVILTTRERHTFSSEVKHFSVLLHIDTLSRKKQGELINKFFVGGEQKQEHFEFFWDWLRGEYGTVGSPLLLSLLCDFAFGKSVEEVKDLNEHLAELVPEITAEFIIRCTTSSTHSLRDKECKTLTSKFLNFIYTKASDEFTDKILKKEFGENSNILINSGLLQITKVSDGAVTYRPIHKMFCWNRNNQSSLQWNGSNRRRMSDSSSSESESDYSYNVRQKFQIMKDMRTELSRLSRDVKKLKLLQFSVLVIFTVYAALSSDNSVVGFRALMSNLSNSYALNWIVVFLKRASDI